LRTHDFVVFKSEPEASEGGSRPNQASLIRPVIISDKEINSAMGVEEACISKIKLWL
jgi:hypothetical protein